MADIDPLSIFFTIVKFAVAILAIVIFTAFYQSIFTEIKTNDLERYSIEAAEVIMSSPALTESRYVFDKAKLDFTNFKFVYVAHHCEFDYSAEVEDLISGRRWRFYGYTPSDALESDSKPLVTDKKIRKFYVTLNFPNETRKAPYYGTVNQTQLTITAYDSLFTRITCLVEKSFVQKEVLSYTIPGCIRNSEDAALCLSLKRYDPYVVCYYAQPTDPRSGGNIRYADCRYMPQEIKFEDTYIRVGPNLDFTGEKVVKTYPLKAAGARCDTITSSDKDKIITKSDPDPVATVLICVEDAK